MSEINHKDKKQVKLLYFANRRQQYSDIFGAVFDQKEKLKKKSALT